MARTRAEIAQIAPARSPSAEQVYSRVLAQLEASAHTLAKRVVKKICACIPEYAAVAASGEAELVATIERNIRFFARWAATDLAIRASERDAFRGQGARRAGMQLPLEVVLRAAGVAENLMRDWIIGAAGGSPAGREAALRLVIKQMELDRAALAAAAEAYSMLQRDHGADEARSRRDLLEDLLESRFPPRPAAARLMARLGFGADAAYEVAVVACAEHTADVDEHLWFAADSLERSLAHRTSSLVVVRHEELVVVASGAEPSILATVVGDVVLGVERARGIRMLAGIGTRCGGIEQVRTGFDEAKDALTIARGGPAPVVSLAGTRVFDYIVSRADGTARRLVPAGVGKLLAEDEKMDGVLVRTLVAYVDADLHVGHAAEALVVHPNTVHYRLRRISEITGCGTRCIRDLVELIVGLRLASSEPAGR